MNTLLSGLAIETAGLVWDIASHMASGAEGEGLIEPAHLVIFVGFVLTFVGAVLVYKKWPRTGSIS